MRPVPIMRCAPLSYSLSYSVHFFLIISPKYCCPDQNTGSGINSLVPQPDMIRISGVTDKQVNIFHAPNPQKTARKQSRQPHGSSTVESLATAHKPQRCGVFLSNFIYFYVACVACLWYNGLEVMTLETIF